MTLVGKATDLQASWWGLGSLHGTLWDIRVSYRKPSVLRLHSWNTRPLFLSSAPPFSSSCRGLSSSACGLCHQMEGCSVWRGGRLRTVVVGKCQCIFEKLSHVPHLWPDTQEAAAVWCSTFTHRLPVSQTLQVVVEGEFCAWMIKRKHITASRVKHLDLKAW